MFDEDVFTGEINNQIPNTEFNRSLFTKKLFNTQINKNIINVLKNKKVRISIYCKKDDTFCIL